MQFTSITYRKVATMDDDEPKKIYRNLAILYAVAFVALLIYIVVMLTEFVKLLGGIMS